MQAAALFAACSVFGRLSAGNEILALSSLGVSPLEGHSAGHRAVALDEPALASGCTTSANRGDKRGFTRSCVNSAETIAYRYLRTKHAYTKGSVTLNVKTVDGKKLIRPMLIMERSDHSATDHHRGRRRRAADAGPATASYRW